MDIKHAWAVALVDPLQRDGSSSALAVQSEGLWFRRRKEGWDEASLIFLFPAKPSKPLCWLMCREGAATPLEDSRKAGSPRLVHAASSSPPDLPANVGVRKASVIPRVIEIMSLHST